MIDSALLHRVRRLAFDTAPLIYFVEMHPDRFERMLDLMRLVDRGQITGIASPIVLAEVLVQPLRAGDTDLAAKYETALTRSRNFHMAPFTVNTARRAADLRARFHIQIADALHVATAIESGCDAFLTNDKGLQRVTDITVLLLNELEPES